MHAYLLCFIFYRYQKVNKLSDEAEKQAKEQMAQERLEGNRNLKNAVKILGLFTDETIPDETTFGTIKQRAFSILTKEQLALVARYLAKATLDETAYEWPQYVRLSQRFKLNLRPIFLALSFESQTKNDPLLLAVVFLRQVFAKGKSLRESDPETFPQAFIPPKLERYIFDTHSIQVNGKRKKSKILNVDKYEFLVYKLLKAGSDAGKIFVRDSRNFKSFEEDLISEEQWQAKDRLIKSLNLPYLDQSIEEILDRLETELEATIKRVNARIKNGENPEIKMTGRGENLRWHLVYHDEAEPVEHPLYSKLPQIGMVDLLLFVHHKTTSTERRK